MSKHFKTVFLSEATCGRCGCQLVQTAKVDPPGKRSPVFCPDCAQSYLSMMTEDAEALLRNMDAGTEGRELAALKSVLRNVCEDVRSARPGLRADS